MDALERALQRERKARKRAEELLEIKSRELYESSKALEDSYAATVQVFANLVGNKSGRSPESLRQLGRDARKLAHRLGLDAEAAKTTYLSAVLCDLGKLALPDTIIGKSLADLTKQEREVFYTHPQLAFEALMALSPLEAVANTILHHCELYDGSGYPRRLCWDDVPVESQALCVVKDFDALVNGFLIPGKLTNAEAIEFLQSHKDKRYGARVVDEFIAQLSIADEQGELFGEQRLTPASLHDGLILTRDLFNAQGVLILPAGQRLSKTLIEKLRKLSEDRHTEMLLYVESQPQLKKDDEQVERIEDPATA